MQTNEAWFRFEAVIAGREPMVDWYKSNDEAEARKAWNEDAHRYGLPMEKVALSVRLATAREVELIS